MSTYDHSFWEISVDPKILESVLTEPSFLEQLLSEPVDEKRSQEKRRIKSEAIDRIREIIEAKLTPRQRQIVGMYFYDGMTQQEISQALGINQQVVSKHLFGVLRNGRKVGGAVRKLRKSCEKLGIDPRKWV